MKFVELRAKLSSVDKSEALKRSCYMCCAAVTPLNMNLHTHLRVQHSTLAPWHICFETDVSASSPARQTETCTECASPLVGLFKSSRQSPNFHFTKPCLWFAHCLQPSMHSLPGFPSHTGCSWHLFQWQGIAAMIRVIVISLFTLILWKEELKKSPGDFNNSSSTL